MAADHKHSTQTHHESSRTFSPPDIPLTGLIPSSFGSAACSEIHFRGGGVVEHLQFGIQVK